MTNGIRLYSSRGSLFAAVLTAELTNPELWNVIGTTIFNTRGESDIPSLKMAAHFYSFAKCFARSRRDYDQKYCYNYIRSKALIYKALGSVPDEFYVRDVAYYLNRPESLLFAYKKDCAGQYFDLLRTHWDSISNEWREFIGNELLRFPWIRRELNDRNLLVGE